MGRRWWLKWLGAISAGLVALFVSGTAIVPSMVIGYFAVAAVFWLLDRRT